MNSHKLLVVNAGQLLTLRGPEGPRSGRWAGEPTILRGGAVLIEGEWITAVGRYRELRDRARGARVIDAEGRLVAPGFVDSHTHPVFIEARLKDQSARLKGKTYAQIAAAGGGILTTVRGVRAAPLEELTEDLHEKAHRFLTAGTTTIEAKSGYGLDVLNELKMLRALHLVGAAGPLDIVPTLLGAHAVPEGMTSTAYSRLVADELVPEAARDGLAVFVDAFCEGGFFTVDECDRVLRAGLRHGLRVKLHAEQLVRYGGAALAARVGAVTADHLDKVSHDDIRLLKRAGTIAGLVPGSNYFLGKAYPPARELINAGVPVALASDFNPGTCPCWNLQQIFSIAVTQMKMLPEEAWVAATINGAYAVGLGDRVGSLEPGKQADVVVYDATDFRELGYWFGSNLCRTTIKAGNVID